ncbi:ATP-binding protein [Streptomyces montanisoli]
MSAGPEEHGPGEERRPAALPERRPARREAATAALGQPSAAHTSAAHPARTVELISGDFLVTVNPVDGSEIEPCAPGQRPGPPVRRDAHERAALRRAGRPSVPPGPAAPPQPLLEREAEHDQLVGLLGRGRSIRLLGVPGSGRSALLDAVAARCATLAPDGLIRLNGYRRTATDLLYELYATVFGSAALHRPHRVELLAAVREIGAIVLVDDLEIGGEALDDLLSATPECAFLFAVTPDVPAPSPGAGVEEVLLAGLGRAASLDILERAVERPLTEAEKNWAGDLWFESEGLPLRFVQAGALLRQRDRLRAAPQRFDEFEAFAEHPEGAGTGTGAGTNTAAETPFDPAFDTAPGADGGQDVPLPSLGEGAAPAGLLASRLSESARETLRFAVALGGEVPHQAHLPALVGDTHADAALGELLHCALLTPVGGRYRLAPGVAAQLLAYGYGDDAAGHARTAAEHYTWWTGHPSVTAERVAQEGDAVLAAMGPLVPDAAGTALRLARSAAPVLLAGLRWGLWEKALRAGQGAARAAGEVAEEAYFHHELGVLALCAGNLDRARAELEASIGMRGIVADKSGTVAGRRALALVSDLELGTMPVPVTPRPAQEYETQPNETRPTPIVAALPAGAAETAPLREPVVSGPVPRPRGGRRLIGGAKRNMVAAGAGAVLAAVMGTVVTLGMASDNSPQSTHTATEQSDPEGDGLPPQEPATDAPQATHSHATSSHGAGGSVSSSPSASGPSGAASPPDAGGAPGGPSHSRTGSTGTTGDGDSGSPSGTGGSTSTSPGESSPSSSSSSPTDGSSTSTSPPPPSDSTSPTDSPTTPPPSSTSPSETTSETISGGGQSQSAQSASATASQSAQ